MSYTDRYNNRGTSRKLEEYLREIGVRKYIKYWYFRSLLCKTFRYFRRKCRK